MVSSAASLRLEPWLLRGAKPDRCAEIGLSSESARLWLSLPQFGTGRDIDSSALALTQGKDVFVGGLHAHVDGITELYLRSVCSPAIDNNGTASRAYGNDRTRVQNFTRDTTYGFGTSIRRGEQIWRL